MNWTERVCMLLVSVVFKRFILFCLRFCWFLWGFVAPRASWGSWGALGELWGVSGATRVGFGTFWGDLGGSLGGVQSSLLGGTYVTNTKGLELGRFSVTWRGVWILFFFFIVFRSVVFVNRGGEFLVKQMKNEGFEFGPLRKFQYKYDEIVAFWRWLVGSKYN